MECSTHSTFRFVPTVPCLEFWPLSYCFLFPVSTSIFFPFYKYNIFINSSMSYMLTVCMWSHLTPFLPQLLPDFPATSPSRFYLFFWQPKFSLWCLYTHECGSIYQRVADLPEVISIKKTQYPSSGSHQLPIVPQLGMEAHETFPCHTHTYKLRRVFFVIFYSIWDD